MASALVLRDGDGLSTWGDKTEVALKLAAVFLGRVLVYLICLSTYDAVASVLLLRDIATPK